ncbi:hypothetical protein ACFFGT_05295 [Mucilaginibacter angelicae]|uniref:Lipoprotein n=1 Tax=Mucilaginibacter angelicae TaxID=869718 RepID=A0ABV6L2U0_9SPHI
MIFKRIILVLILLPSLTLISCGQTPFSIPGEFIKTSPPKVGSDEWYVLNGSQNEFGVSIVNGKLDIKKVNEVNKSVLKIPSGTLIGVNRGEWGGQLTFKPSDTTKKNIDIKEGNIKFIFKLENKIYFIEGLAHMSYSGGALFELHTTGEKFTFTQLVKFEDAPEAFTIYKDKLLIATHKNFYIVKDFKKELVFKEAFWSSLYPNSIAAFDDKNVFMGIRSGIIKLDLTDKSLIFYKYKE